MQKLKRRKQKHLDQVKLTLRHSKKQQQQSTTHTRPFTMQFAFMFISSTFNSVTHLLGITHQREIKSLNFPLCKSYQVQSHNCDMYSGECFKG